MFPGLECVPDRPVAGDVHVSQLGGGEVDAQQQIKLPPGFRAFDTAAKFRENIFISRICSESRRISLTPHPCVEVIARLILRLRSFSVGLLDYRRGPDGRGASRVRSALA